MIKIEPKYQIGEEVYFVSPEFCCKTKILDIAECVGNVKKIKYFMYKLDLTSPGLYCYMKNCVQIEDEEMYGSEDWPECFDRYDCDEEFIKPDDFGWILECGIVRSEEEAIKYFEEVQEYFYMYSSRREEV